MKAPRRWQMFVPSEIVRTAYLAGRGSSAPEIAESLGGGRTARHIYELVRRHGIALVPKKRNQIAFPLVVSTETMEIAERMASANGVDPERLIARVVERVIVDRALVGQVIAKMEG